MSDHANNTAATTAGWKRTQTDRGASRSPRYHTVYEKNVGNVGSRSSAVDRHDAFSDVSQADADTLALDALNGARKLRYGAGASAGTDGRGTSLTFDS